MDRVYFRQEALIKYEEASGFEMKDDGSVSCYHYWGLARSTARLGNELCSTAIGDFAEGVPFEEWRSGYTGSNILSTHPTADRRSA